MSETIEYSTTGERFDAEIAQIKTDFAERCPNGPYLSHIGTRLDWESNYAEYFMRHFQAARNVLHDEGTSNEDLAKVESMMDALAWVDNYFLETYNSNDRRRLEIFISKQLQNPENVDTDILEAMVMMLDMQIEAESRKISEAKSRLDASEKVEEVLGKESE